MPGKPHRLKDYPDLGAIVHLNGVPPDVAARPAPLYGSFRCSPGNLAAFSTIQPEGACVLDTPEHVLLFAVRGERIIVLNQVFAIGPAEASRAFRALFRALPGARLIHVQLMFPLRELGLPLWNRGAILHFRIALPDTVEAYDAMIGRSTRKRLRGYENRLRREHPDARMEVISPGERSRELVDLYVTWKLARFHAAGRTTYWENDAKFPEHFAELVRLGEVHMLTVAGKPAAIVFNFPAGDMLCALEAAFDAEYEHLDVGLLTLREVAREAVRRGAKTLDLTSGDREYKERLGATMHMAWGVSVFRRQVDKLWAHARATASPIAGSGDTGTTTGACGTRHVIWWRESSGTPFRVPGGAASRRALATLRPTG
jgi:hypothetical protein